MANPARSLNTTVDWRWLLRELGVPVGQWSLPTQTSCPICQVGVISVREDFLVGGQWHHCPDCGSTGDLIELASRVWKLSIPTTIIKLMHRGFDLPKDQAVVDKYIAQHIDYRRRMDELWQDAVAEMKHPSGELQRLAGLFNLRSDVPAERWQEGPGSLLGGIATERIERAFAPGVMDHADDKGQRCSPSEHAIFHGTGWRDALVVPYHDLPGRICGFLFIGRDGKYPDDFLFRRANYGPRGNQHCPVVAEAGLAMHPQALASSNEWDRVVVATAKPMTGLALQMRHFEQSLEPLPLVLWYDSLRRKAQHGDGQRIRTTNAWQLLDNRQVIFWMPEFCVATIEQAMAVNGLISTAGPRSPNAEALQAYVWKFTPRDLLRHIVQSARPWQEGLAQAFKGMNNTTIERQVKRMQVDGIDVERMIKKCGPAAQKRVRHMFAQTSQRVAKLINGKTVVERSGNWYVRSRLGQESLISDGIVRVDCILVQRSQQKAYARGRIIHNGQSVSYCEPLDQLETQGLHWAQNLLMQRGVGYMIFDPTYNRYLVDLARVFHEPRLETAITSVGWDEKHRLFVFPGFSLDEKGEVIHPENLILDQPAPAKFLRHPDDCLTPEELDRGSGKDKATKLFWAVLGCMVANVVADACHRPRAGIALVGTGAEQMGKALASALGCIRLDVESAKDVRRALEHEHSHGWPLLVLERRRLQRRFRRDLLNGDRRVQRNLIVGIDWYESRVLALGDKWNVIESLNSVDIRPDLTTYARKFTVAYVQDLCRRRFQMGDWREQSDAHAEIVLRDMSRFVREQEGNEGPIFRASKLILPARENGHAIALADLVAQWLRTGKLQIENNGGEGRGPILIRDQQDYRLEKEVLAELTKDLAVDEPSFHVVTAALNDAEVLTDDRSDGWKIDGAWLDQKVESAALPMQVVG